jgi:DnaA family protein
MNPQLPLILKLKDSATFDSYFAGGNNEIITYLRRWTENPQSPNIYLWGEPGTGKSHLLQAVCHAAGARNVAAVYLAMQTADQIPCEALHGLENVGTVCIDDISLIAGRIDWETALFRLLDRIFETNGGLVVTGNALPTQLGLQSAQLLSRLAGCLPLQLRPLEPIEKLQALQQRAARRGLTLTTEAGRYLVRHYGRNTNILFAALEILDQASMAAQRKLTIPFMRATLSQTSFLSE